MDEDVTDKYGYLLAKIDLNPLVELQVHDGLEPLVDSFLVNLARVNAVQQFPIFAAGMSKLWSRHFERVCLENGIPYEQDQCPEDKFPSIIAETHLRVFKANLKDLEEKELNQNGESSLRLIFIDYQDTPHFRNTINSAFQSMLINAWTSIEVLLRDLHDLAAKGRPPLTTDAKQQNWRIMALAKEKGFSIGKPKEWDEEERPNLSSLDGARQAYAVLFSVDSAEIDECLSDLAFEELYRLRNQFVHQGGKITGSFKNYTNKLPSFTAHKKKGASIILHGADAKMFIENALRMSIKLIKSVDLWLQNHPLNP